MISTDQVYVSEMITAWLYCYLCFIYSKTIYEIKIIQKCSFILICLILILLTIFSIFTIFICFFGTIILIILSFTIGYNETISTISTVLQIIFYLYNFFLTLLCTLLIIIISLRLIFVIFRITIRVSKEYRKKNFLSLFKIIFLVSSVVIFLLIGILLTLLAITSLLFRPIWVIPYLGYCIDLLFVGFAFYFAFGPIEEFSKKIQLIMQIK